MAAQETAGKQSRQGIKFSILHQPSSANAKELLKELADFHMHVREELQSRLQAIKGQTDEFSSKCVQSLKGNLSEFLSTPLRSDMEDIQKRIEEHVRQALEFMQANPYAGLEASYESKVVNEDMHDVFLKSLFASGGKLLKAAGFVQTDASAPVHVSEFFVTSQSDLLLLEHVLQYFNTAAGKSPFERAHMAVHELLPFPESGQDTGDKFELSLIFNGPQVESPAFIRELQGWCSASLLSVPAVWWKKRFSCNSPFQLVCSIPARDRAILKQRMQLCADRLPALKKHIHLKNIALIVKERVLS